MGRRIRRNVSKQCQFVGKYLFEFHVAKYYPYQEKYFKVNDTTMSL